MRGGGEIVINEGTFRTNYPIPAECPRQVRVRNNTDIGNAVRDHFVEMDAHSHYDAEQWWDAHDQYQDSLILKPQLRILEAIALAVVALRAQSYLAYASASEIASLTAAGAYGLAAVAGIGLGAGIYYSGTGEYIGTTQLGELIGEGIYNLIHPDES